MPARGRGRHGGGRGRQPVWVWLPRDRVAGVDETSQNRATGERSGHAEHDPYRNQPSRGGAGRSGGRGFNARGRGRAGPPDSRHGGEHVRRQEHSDLPPSAQRLDKLRGKTTLKESPVTATSSPILVRKPEDWYFTFYIRTDLQGFYHTYPDVHGPFKTLQEADNAIDRHLHDLEDPKMSSDSLDKLSLKERAVRESLYWPDGTRKKCLEPPDESEDEVHLLLEALVDQYNEDHNLLGNHALQLKDVQRERFFFSKGNTYNHFNFTARTEGVIDSFFAEVQCTDDGEHEEIVVSCFCVVKPNDNGRCYGCQNNGAVDMKHPNKANAYCRGQVDEYMPCLGGYHIEQSYLTESVEDEEERLRSQYECFDDPSFMAEHFPYS
ncbi:uncharacterized protein [Lolium perenne]|uniref:uncharacterized protein n=1 Tax=Lolium perenne TaxID=4522 RepID=UPI0021F5EC75|nr:uncharacterized protein LOC127348775 [Lolium perenne]